MSITPEQRLELLRRAQQARQRAYAPYSRYQVGASLLTTAGHFFDGANVENASYPLTTCAERAVVSRAVSDGERQFIAIAVVTDNGGSPCGACRQVLAEFGLDTLVLIADSSGQVVHETTVRQLLPDAFTPSSLGY